MKVVFQRTAVKSTIDSVPGSGSKRRRMLISRFGSSAGVKAASLEDMVTIPGITTSLARRIKEYL